MELNQNNSIKKRSINKMRQKTDLGHVKIGLITIFFIF